MVADIKELILNLKAQDIGVLITDHNVREAIRLVDRVLHNLRGHGDSPRSAKGCNFEPKGQGSLFG
jgi:ABC-type Mn2+/Zn2+ transport system ATPase subunit